MIDMRQIAAGLAVAFLGVCGVACDEPPAPVVPECEQGIATIVASTVDHRPTIAQVNIARSTASCMVSGPCRPGGGLACSMVSVSATSGAHRCELTFVSIDGEAFSTSVQTELDEGPGHKCMRGGEVVTAHGIHFVQGAIAVDFMNRNL
jgi:hypothetical protein